MGNTLYWLLRAVGAFSRYRLVGRERLPQRGPAVYLANHLGSLGPVVIVLSVPIRFYPWVKADLTDRRRSPGHLLREFVRPVLHLSGWAGLGMANLISAITVPLLRGIGCIPVEADGPLTRRAFRESLARLQEGRSVLIFPEDSRAPADPETEIHLFNGGFVELCRLYHRMTGVLLPVYPLAVNPHRKCVVIGAPAYYVEQTHWRESIAQFADRMREEIRQLYLSV